jgi:Flp pilus assembly protein TadG
MQFEPRYKDLTVKARPQSTVSTISRRLRRDESGAIAIMFALMLPVVLGAIGMGVEIGNWFASKRELQSAADAAALAGALESNAGSTSTTITSEATTEAQRNGFTTSGGGTIAVNNPPTSGSYGADGSAVEVILTRPIQTTFVRYLIGASSLTTTARAVAKMQTGDGEGCVVALNSSAAWALRFSGSVTIGMSNCDMVANSTDTAAIRATGSVNVTADCIRTAGNYSTTGTASLNATGCGSVQTGSKTYGDPYEDRSIESYSTSCDAAHTNKSISGSTNTTLSPGVYCGGITVSGSQTITFNPGTYILHNGDFDISGSGALSGSGVTIILTGSSASSVGNIDLTGSRTVNMSAPTSGSYSGMLFYQSRSASSSGTNKITGSTNFNITGAVYTPNRKLDFSGSSGGGTNCVQLIADTIEFTGSSGGNSANCDSAGVTLAGPMIAGLVE